MKYLVCNDLCDKYDENTVYISTDEDAEKNDLVVYMDYDGPSLAKVVNIMDELSAITSDKHFTEAVKVVSMKAYMEKRAKEIQKAKLVKLRKEQMEIQKLEDTLKKNSECNEEMAKLFAQYKELNG